VTGSPNQQYHCLGVKNDNLRTLAVCNEGSIACTASECSSLESRSCPSCGTSGVAPMIAVDPRGKGNVEPTPQDADVAFWWFRYHV